MKTLTRKGYSRIYVKDAADVERVKAIIKELDEFEYDYMPDLLVAPFEAYPDLVYTGKFDDLDMHKLTAVCWNRGIFIWVCDNETEEYQTNHII